MSLFERVVSQQVEFLFVVGRSGAFNNVAFDVFLLNRDAFLDVLTDETSGGGGVRCGEMTHSQVELEPFRDGGFQRRNLLEEVDRFGPRGGVCVVNEDFL